MAPAAGRCRMSACRTVAFAVAISFLVPGFIPCSSSGSAEDDFVALVESVSAADMMTTVEDLQAFGSREFHLESSREAAEYIYGRLVETGLAVEYQEFELDGINISNVVAIKEGGDPGAGCFLFGAHYDSENRLVDSLSAAENITAPGADDDASGVAAVIELARLLSDVALRNTVKFVAFAAEEYGYDNSGGLKGSHHFVASEVEGNVSYEGTAILDMIGYRSGLENRAVIVTEQPGDRMAEATVEAVGKYAIDLDVVNIVEPRISYSDHSSFWGAGYPSMLVIEELSEESYIPLNPYYHTSNDVASSLSEEQMAAVTQALLGGVLQLAVGEEGSGISSYVAIALASSACAVAIAAFMILRKVRTERR